MRSLLACLSATALLVAGCHSKPPPRQDFADPALAGKKAVPVEPSKPKLIVTPAADVAGKVAMVNNASRFVVLNYPLGHLPAANQRLSLYRRGLKVGEIKITGPQYDDNIVADLVAGEGEVGDEVRE